MEIRLDYTPQPKQALLHSAPANQIFYGGAAGGGKSHCIRWDLISLCLDIPGLECFLFRRTRRELEGTHVRRIQQEIPAELGKYKGQANRFEFFNGSGINFCFCEKETDVNSYQSEEMHVLAFDEASHFTENQLTYLRTRVRLGGFKAPEKYKGVLPRLLMGSNPGGPGHTFLKKTFIDPAPPMTVFHDKTTADGDYPGHKTIYIPAGMKDNKYLESSYGGQFTALEPELARALKEGDWDAVVGQALHTLSREKHCLRPFKPPRHWTKMMSIDWGTAKPFSVGWYCVSDGAILEAKEGWPERYLPAGAVIRYAEWYGWDGKANKGCRKDSKAVAREILRLEDSRGEVMDYRIGDSQMWAQSDGPSPAENMLTASSGRIALKPSKKDRRVNYEEFLCRLAGSPHYMSDGTIEEFPMFYATADCTHFWRTCPTLTLDQNDPDKGPDTNLEDHPYDDAAYLLRSRPFAMTEEDRWEAENADHIRRIKGGNDPYAT